MSYLTLDEMCNVLEELNDYDKDLESASVLVIPPINVDYLTDEEHLNDDNTEDVQVTEVAGNLELQIVYNDIDPDSKKADECSNSDNI